MKLNRRTDYALRAITYLSVRQDNGPCSIAEIAEAEKIPREFTAKVLKELCRTGFLRSRLGPHGGYRLAKPPDQMTVLEIMEALDGPLAINDCLAEPHFCGQTPGCRMHRLFQRVNDSMKEILGRTSIADIARSEVFRVTTTDNSRPGEDDKTLTESRPGALRQR